MNTQKEDALPFEIIFKQYKEKIFRLIYRLTNSYEEAEDITSDVFVSAYSSYAGFQGKAEVYSWLYRIALNHCTNNLIRDKRRKKGIASLNDPIKEDIIYIDDELVKKEKEAWVRAGINGLPEKYRGVIILREIEGLNYEEIAKILDISKQTVGIRLLRGRMMLKKKLGVRKDEM